MSPPLPPAEGPAPPEGPPPPLRPALPGRTFFAFGWWFYLVLALAGAMWMALQERGVGLERFAAGTAKDIGFDLVLGAGMALVLVLLWAAARLLPAAREIEREMARQLGGIDASAAVVLALISGVAEEVFFRGALQTAWGPLAATILFAAVHWGPSRAFRLWTAFAALAGATFAIAVEWRGTLLSAIVAHALTNLVGLSRLRQESAHDAR